MKVLLDSLDFLIPADKLDAVKNACNSGQVKRVSQINQNSWLYQLRWEDALLECKLSYGTNQLKSIHCACGCQNAQHPCIHAWVLAYWHTHHRTSERTRAHDLRKNRSEIRKNLDQQSTFDLVEFTDLALQLHPELYSWASLLLPPNPYDQTHEENIFAYYFRLLNDFSSDIKTKSGVRNIRDLKNRLVLIEKLQNQAMHHFVQGEISKPCEMLMAIIFSNYQFLLLIPEINAEKLLSSHAHLIQSLHQMIKALKAPERRHQLFELLHKNICEQEHWITHRHDNLFHLLFSFHEEKKALKNFEKNVLPSLMSHPHFFESAEETLWALYYDFDDSAWSHWIQKLGLLSKMGSHLLLPFVYGLSELRADDKSRKILLAIAEDKHHAQVSQLAAEKYLEYLIESNRVEELSIHSRKWAIRWNQMRFVKLWDTAGKPDHSTIQQFLSECHKSKNFHREFYLDGLCYWEKSALLLEEMEAETDLHKLMQRDALLLRDHPEACIKIYLRHSQEYLDQYGGQKAYEFVQAIKLHLLQSGFREAEKKYELQLLEMYPDRISLFSHQKKNQKIEI